MSGPHAEDHFHHVLPVASDWDVMATIVNHTDRGDGYCAAGTHEGVPPLDPCGVRLYHEAVLHDRRR